LSQNKTLHEEETYYDHTRNSILSGSLESIKLITMCELLYWSHDKQCHWSTSSTYQSCWYVSPLSALVCIPFQSHGYSVHTNADSKNHMITASDNGFGLVYCRNRQRSEGTNSGRSGKLLSSFVLGFRTVLTLSAEKY